jgi:hypothetical protein
MGGFGDKRRDWPELAMRFFEGALLRRGHVAGNNIRRNARYTRRRDACATLRAVQAVDRINRILKSPQKPKLAAGERKEHKARRADSEWGYACTSL